MLTNSRRVSGCAIISSVWGSPKATTKRGPEASPLHASENITSRDNRRIYLHHYHHHHLLLLAILVLSFSSVISLLFPLSLFLLSSFLSQINFPGEWENSSFFCNVFQSKSCHSLQRTSNAFLIFLGPEVGRVSRSAVIYVVLSVHVNCVSAYVRKIRDHR